VVIAVGDLRAGDVLVALLWPNGFRQIVRGGPLQVEGVRATGGCWEGQPQLEILSGCPGRSSRYSNGATHAEIVLG